MCVYHMVFTSCLLPFHQMQSPDLGMIYDPLGLPGVNKTFGLKFSELICKQNHLQHSLSWVKQNHEYSPYFPTTHRVKSFTIFVSFAPFPGHPHGEFAVISSIHSLIHWVVFTYTSASIAHPSKQDRHDGCEILCIGSNVL